LVCCNQLQPLLLFCFCPLQLLQLPLLLPLLMLLKQEECASEVIWSLMLADVSRCKQQHNMLMLPAAW
jgi:hypothetical protein